MKKLAKPTQKDFIDMQKFCPEINRGDNITLNVHTKKMDYTIVIQIKRLY